MNDDDESLKILMFDLPDRWMFYRDGEIILVVDKGSDVVALKACLDMLEKLDEKMHQMP
jgi:hypothetical protein